MTKENRDLLEQFLRLNKMMMKYQFMNFRARGPFGNPQRGQGRVLSILKMKPEITQKELAYLLDMRNQSLGELLSKLEKKGLVNRRQSEEDKRVMIVQITEDGKKASEESDDESNEIDDIFDCLTKEEQENLKVYLSKLTEEMKKNNKDMDCDDFHHGKHEKFKRGFEEMSRGFPEGSGGPRRGRGKHPHPFIPEDER